MSRATNERVANLVRKSVPGKENIVQVKAGTSNNLSEKADTIYKSELRTNEDVFVSDFSDCSIESNPKKEKKKRSTDSSLLDILNDQTLMKKIYAVIDQYNNEENNKQMRSYSLFEDLRLIEAMSRKISGKKGFGPEFWKEVIRQHISTRPNESLRDRYKRQLKYLTQDDMRKILNWIDKHQSVKGFLNLVKTNKGRKFSHISVEDPFTIKRKPFSGRKNAANPPSESEIEDDENEDGNRVKREASESHFQRKKGKNVKLSQGDSDFVQLKQLKTEDVFYNFVYDDDSFVSGNSVEFLYKINPNGTPPQRKEEEKLEQEIVEKQEQDNPQQDIQFIESTQLPNTYIFDQPGTSFQPRPAALQDNVAAEEKPPVVLQNLNQEEDQIINNMRQVIHEFMIRYNLERADIIEKLKQVSWNINDFIQVVEQNQKCLLWDDFDDMVLRNCESPDNDLMFMQLKKYKGRESIINRIKYLNLNKPFIL